MTGIMTKIILKGNKDYSKLFYITSETVTIIDMQLSTLCSIFYIMLQPTIQTLTMCVCVCEAESDRYLATYHDF